MIETMTHYIEVVFVGASLFWVVFLAIIAVGMGVMCLVGYTCMAWVEIQRLTAGEDKGR